MLDTELEVLAQLGSQQPMSSSGFPAIPKDISIPAFGSRMSDTEITSQVPNQDLVKTIRV